MRICDVKTCRVITPYDMTLVKVFTDEGVSGIGEAYHGQGVRDVIINPYRSLKEIVVGEDPKNLTNPIKPHRNFKKETLFSGHLKHVYLLVMEECYQK